MGYDRGTALGAVLAANFDLANTADATDGPASRSSQESPWGETLGTAVLWNSSPPAKRSADKHHAILLGRGRYYPIALDGAIKLKEISQAHAEAYRASQLKHGPLTPVHSGMLIIAMAPNDQLLDNLKSNLREVHARGGELSEIPPSDGVHNLHLPKHYGEISSVPRVIPPQLLSYHSALAEGMDLDNPRNPAESVTVE